MYFGKANWLPDIGLQAAQNWASKLALGVLVFWPGVPWRPPLKERRCTSTHLLPSFLPIHTYKMYALCQVNK